MLARDFLASPDNFFNISFFVNPELFVKSVLPIKVDELPVLVRFVLVRPVIPVYALSPKL